MVCPLLFFDDNLKYPKIQSSNFNTSQLEYSIKSNKYRAKYDTTISYYF